MLKSTLAVLLTALPLTAYAGVWDGNYSGGLTQTGSNAMNCAHTAPVQMNIQGDTLTYHHFSNATFTAKVAMDGTFKDTQQIIYGSTRNQSISTLSGQIGPTGISATVSSQYCSYQLKLRRQS